jgi:hypothetical protein
MRKNKKGPLLQYDKKIPKKAGMEFGITHGVHNNNLAGDKGKQGGIYTHLKDY